MSGVNAIQCVTGATNNDMVWNASLPDCTGEKVIYRSKYAEGVWTNSRTTAKNKNKSKSKNKNKCKNKNKYKTKQKKTC